jgi:hypothetical protein
MDLRVWPTHCRQLEQEYRQGPQQHEDHPQHVIKETERCGPFPSLK